MLVDLFPFARDRNGTRLPSWKCWPYMQSQKRGNANVNGRKYMCELP